MRSLKSIFGLSVLTGLSVIMSACGPSGNKPNVELMQDMMVQEADQAQKYDDFFQDTNSAARVPPEHTVPVGFKNYRWGQDFVKASAENKNPIAGEFSKDVLMIGQKQYETSCMVCHGVKGLGDGYVGKFMPKTPPSLMTDKIRNWTDGGIYHVVTMGQGTMGPYASHVPQSSRWQLINYIRHMQKMDNESKK